MIEKKVQEMLEATRFHDQDADVLHYHNECDASRQVIEINYVLRYDSVKEAAETATGLNHYIKGAFKGTEDMPSKTHVLRAFKSKRVPLPDMRFTHVGDQVYLFIEMQVPVGQDGTAAVQHTLDTLGTLIEKPLIIDDNDLYQELVDEALRSIDDRIQYHGWMAVSSCLRLLFDDLYVLTSDDEKALIGSSDPNDLKDLLDHFLDNAFPIILSSGSTPAEEILDVLSPYLRGDTEAIFEKREYSILEQVSDPIHVDGPSEQMHYFRLYPLAEQPETDLEMASLELLGDILGNGFTSRLMQIVREKHHLVYGIYGRVDYDQDVLFINTNYDPDKHDKIQRLTGGIVRDMFDGGFTEDEVEHFKEMAMEKLILSYGTSGLETCDLPGYRVRKAHDMYVTMHEDHDLACRYQLLDSITYESVRDACRFIDATVCQEFTYGGEK